MVASPIPPLTPIPTLVLVLTVDTPGWVIVRRSACPFGLRQTAPGVVTIIISVQHLGILIRDKDAAVMVVVVLTADIIMADMSVVVGVPTTGTLATLAMVGATEENAAAGVEESEPFH